MRPLLLRPCPRLWVHRDSASEVAGEEKHGRLLRQGVHGVDFVYEATPHELVLHLQRAAIPIGVFRHVEIGGVQEIK